MKRAVNGIELGKTNGKKLHWVAFVTFVAVAGVVGLVTAANFNASASPSSLNASCTSTLLNFSISNTDATENITKVNITLPTGFTYSGDARQNIGTFSLLENERILSWYNGSGIVPASTTEYLWFDVNCPSAVGEYKFNVSTVDTANVLTSKNVTLNVVDVLAPKWSSNSTTPSTPTHYGLNKNYTFTITWTDNVAVDQVIFEWNGATNYTNTTSPNVTNLGSGRYSITLTDLNVGYYTYRWYANDTNNTFNSTGSLGYNVTKLDNVVDIYFNGNKNQDIVVYDGTDVNITVTGYGTLFLYENGKLISSGIGPLTNIKTPSVGDYTYKANATGTSNYTTNSTGATYEITVIYPPPRYSVSTDIPDTWYDGATANFSITWSDLNDPNGFDVALLESNHSGSRVNYTMTRLGSTNVSFYSINLTQPLNFSWRVYANNSFDSWNSTNLTFVEVKKIIPTINLSVIPSWNVAKGTQTTVRCHSDDVSVNLYRDGASVSNPDIQTLTTGEYVYVCNNSANVNYSSLTVLKILTVVSTTKNISFTKAESLVSVKQNSTNSTEVTIKNTGAVAQIVTFSIEGIDESFYSLNSTTAYLNPGESATFLVTFNISESAEVKDYSGAYKGTTTYNVITSDFTLRVLPTEKAMTDIENLLLLYRVNITRLWSEINKSKEEGLNTTLAENKITEANEKADLAENYISEGRYTEANEILNDIKSLIAGAEAELTSAREVSPPEQRHPSLSWLWTLGIVGLVVIVLIYLLWPQPGYDPRKRKYVYKTPKQLSTEKIEEVKDRLKRTVFGKPYTTSFKPSLRRRKSSDFVEITLKEVPSKEPVELQPSKRAAAKEVLTPTGIKAGPKKRFSIENFLKKFRRKKG